jgi:glutathione S-transferase
MELYYFEAMSPRKACAVARYLDAPVEFIWLDPRKGDHKAPNFLSINPNGKLPVLVDGDTIVWEANAVMCYLARSVGSDLWPQDERQIDVIRWFSWDAAHFTRYTGMLYFEHIIKPRFNIGPADATVVDEALKMFRQFGRVLDDHLAEREYLVGAALTVADFAVACTLPYAENARIPLAEFPAMQRWHARLSMLPAWRQPFPADAHNEATEMCYA